MLSLESVDETLHVFVPQLQTHRNDEELVADLVSARRRDFVVVRVEGGDAVLDPGGLLGKHGRHGLCGFLQALQTAADESPYRLVIVRLEKC